MKTKEYKRLLGYYVAAKRQPRVKRAQSKRTVRCIGEARGQKFIAVYPPELHHY